MNPIGPLIERIFFERRGIKLAQAIAPLLPTNGSLLDVGCGDGEIDLRLKQLRPDVEFTGIDVQLRNSSAIPVQHFDGTTIPFPDRSFDAVMFVDVLHHTQDPAILLKEALRVARRFIILKDHTRDGLLAFHTLAVMDWLGNAHHHIPLPFHFLSKAEWLALFDQLQLKVDSWNSNLGQYPASVGWIVERQLHMVARLSIPNGDSTASTSIPDETHAPQPPG